MTDGQELAPGLVAQKASAIFTQRRHRLAALLEGSGEPGRVSVEGMDVEIVPTRSELALRRAMSARDSEDAAVLYLVDWADPSELSRDIRARVAEGKLYRIGRDERLRQVFHATRLGADLLASPLARLAAQGEVDTFPASPRLSLDLTSACFTWLWQVLGDSFSRTAPRESDFVHACRSADPGSLLAKMERSADWRSWVDATGRILSDHLAPWISVVWHAWLARRLDALPALLWIEEAFVVARAAPADRKLLRMVLKTRYGSWAEQVESLGVSADGHTVSAWDKVLRGDEVGKQPRELTELVESLDLPHVFEASSRLPQGLAAREQALASALQALLRELRASSPDRAVWDRVASSMDALGKHLLLDERRREGLQMLQRLAAWLFETASGRGWAAKGRPADQAVSLASRFAQEGGFIDWARRIADRECPKGELGAAWAGVVAEVESQRDAQEEAFAYGVRDWAAEGRRGPGCLPIEHASRDLVANFLRGGRDRRLLVLLMDGMSWARCRELCASLRPDGWEPLRWRPMNTVDGAFPPVMAALPTITSVSRAAFFAGKHPESGDLTPTSADPDRWRRNPAVKDFVDPRGRLELFLKDRVEADRGLPSHEVLEAIADPDRPLVAAVVNTIDDAIKATPSLDFATGATEIKPLREMLLRARGARRAVLLIADHGHVSGRRTVRVDSDAEAGGARWRIADTDQPLRAHEVLLESGAWSPQRGRGVVLLSGETAQYNIHSHHGEHGGISLAEVVAPAVLLGTQDLVDVGQVDRDLEIAPPDEPRWWREQSPELGPVTADEKPPTTPATLFGDLGTVEAVSGPPRPGRSVRQPSWLASLRTSDTFKTALRFAAVAPADRPKLEEQAIAVCRLLVEEGGRASTASVAKAADVSLARVQGIVARVSSVLNADGETCVTFDAAGQSLVLDLQRFQALFGVDTEGV